MATVSAMPARVLALNKGPLAPGLDADVVLLDETLQPQLTMVEGQVVYHAFSVH